ncbi:HAD family hydrolase [Crocinitomix catalasitica]|uniref:HAD family hydrolase n=1 Tax=Crocinitomix catalasitica TaxID=184607 RepID=UPI0004838676|nr:HAD family phosphatase [Crocinitomix catalasitica]
MENKLEAIIFDLGGVIIDLDYNKTINAFKSIGKKDFEHLYSQAQQVGLFNDLEIGAITPEVFRVGLNELLKENYSDQIIDEAWNKMLLKVPNHRIEFLESIGKKYRIFLYSNTNAIHYEAFRNQIEKDFQNINLLEELFEQTYYSHILGKRKPHGDSFQHILDEQNLTASKTLFIDDSIQHIEGAQSIGLNVIHLVDQEVEDAVTSYLS